MWLRSATIVPMTAGSVLSPQSSVLSPDHLIRINSTSNTSIPIGFPFSPL
jgi:hypothetical protein